MTNKPANTALGGNINETQLKILDIFKIHEKDSLKKMVLLGSENNKELIRSITISAHCLCISSKPTPPWPVAIKPTKSVCLQLEELMNSDTDEDWVALNDYVVSEAASYDTETRLLFTDEKLCKDIEESVKLISEFNSTQDWYDYGGRDDRAESDKVSKMLVAAVKTVGKYYQFYKHLLSKINRLKGFKRKNKHLAPVIDLSEAINIAKISEEERKMLDELFITPNLTPKVQSSHSFEIKYDVVKEVSKVTYDLRNLIEEEEQPLLFTDSTETNEPHTDPEKSCTIIMQDSKSIMIYQYTP